MHRYMHTYYIRTLIHTLTYVHVKLRMYLLFAKRIVILSKAEENVHNKLHITHMHAPI